MEKITINKLELASELAHEKLLDTCGSIMNIYNNECDDTLSYTDEAQDIFNKYYDYYLELIENTVI